ncbi:MAG: DUF2235 domain-containing protein [Geminicoccaceae bacterium]
MMRQRNIVLLSDGTGNSSAKLNKTNVWRLYQALDLAGDKQIAFYDDGVGTSGFKPLKLLGGLFGWGLSRNIRDLYLQLCDHYRHVDPGDDAIDHIYIFGFSRGAFTARTLAGLIAKCGILDKASEQAVPVSTWRWRQRRASIDSAEGLQAGVNLAYRSYRYGYSAVLTNIWRWFTRWVYHEIPKPEEFRASYGRPVKITFVGVFDTVAAVGLPIDELSLLMDRLIYPHRFSDQDLSKDVQRACHALAVDDERHSFHPVLWNEEKETDPDRITQVWFPGMHSDVGGGYADEGLAYTPLKWMIDRVKRSAGNETGLDFRDDAITHIESRTNASARMHNARSGFGVYYRYKPRDIDRLCHRPESAAPVVIEAPKVHHSIFDRVATGTDGYAPIGIPASYRLVDAGGTISEGCEGEDQRDVRGALLDRAKNHVFWRRIQYFLFALTTLGFAALPFLSPPVPSGGRVERFAAWLGELFGVLGPLIPAFLSHWFDSWIDGLIQVWPWALALAVIYLGLLSWERFVRTNTVRLSELAWWPIRFPNRPRPHPASAGRFENLAKRLRTSPLARSGYRFVTRKALPVTSFILAFLFLINVGYRLIMPIPVVEAGDCVPVSGETACDTGDPVPVETPEF